MGNETNPAQQPEVVSPYEGVGNADLIVKFYEEAADPNIGRELSARLLAHAGYVGDPASEPLTGRDGKQMRDATTGAPLTLADYVNYATEHHFYALEGILDFLHTKPGDPAYETGRATYASYLDSGRRQVDRG